MKFIKDYPESPLTGQAVERIGWLYNRHVPPAAEAAWQRSARIAQSRQDARRRAQEKAESLCGPECLAELLRRCGKLANADALGKFEISGLDQRPYVLVASAEGYLPQAKAYSPGASTRNLCFTLYIC